MSVRSTSLVVGRGTGRGGFGSLVFEEPFEAAKGAALELLDRTSAAPGRLGDLIDREIADEAEGQDLPLVVGEMREQLEHTFVGEPAVRLDPNVAPDRLRFWTELCGLRTPAFTPNLVDHAIAGDAKQPRAEGVFVALERTNRPERIHEHVVDDDGHVLHAASAHEPGETGVPMAKELVEGPRLPGASTGEHVVEVSGHER